MQAWDRGLGESPSAHGGVPHLGEFPGPPVRLRARCPGSKTNPEASKTAQEGLQDGPRGLQERSGDLQGGPKAFWRAQDASKTTQVSSKISPRCPKTRQEAEHVARAQNAYFCSTAAPSEKKIEEGKSVK